MLTRPSWTWRPSAPLGGRAFGGRKQIFASADAFGNRVFVEARLLARELPFVFVHDVDRGALERGQQIVFVEDREALPRIDDRLHPGRLQVASVVDHGLATVWRNDADRKVLAHVGDLRLMGAIHGTRMERDDLVVARVGRNEARGRVLVLDHTEMIPAHAALIHPIRVRAKVRPDRREKNRVDPEAAEVVRDIRAGPAVLLHHRGNVEGHVQLLKFVGDEVVLEMIFEAHNVIDGDGSGDQNGH